MRSSFLALGGNIEIQGETDSLIMFTLENSVHNKKNKNYVYYEKGLYFI